MQPQQKITNYLDCTIVQSAITVLVYDCNGISLGWFDSLASATDFIDTEVESEYYY